MKGGILIAHPLALRGKNCQPANKKHNNNMKWRGERGKAPSTADKVLNFSRIPCKLTLYLKVECFIDSNAAADITAVRYTFSPTKRNRNKFWLFFPPFKELEKQVLLLTWWILRQHHRRRVNEFAIFCFGINAGMSVGPPTVWNKVLLPKYVCPPFSLLFFFEISSSSLISLLIFFFLAFYLLDSSFLVECNLDSPTVRCRREKDTWKRRQKRDGDGGKRGHFRASSTCSSFREHALCIYTEQGSASLFFCCIPDSRYIYIYIEQCIHHHRCSECWVYTPRPTGRPAGTYRSFRGLHSIEPRSAPRLDETSLFSILFSLFFLSFSLSLFL